MCCGVVVLGDVRGQLRERVMSAAEVLAQHRPYGLDCACGRPINSNADWSRHADEALKAAGYAVFELAPLADILETRASRAEDTHDRLVMAGMRTTSQFHSGYASAMLEARTEILSAADAAEDYYPSEGRP